MTRQCHCSCLRSYAQEARQDQGFLNQLLEMIKFPGAIVPKPWKACNVSSTHANVVRRQLLDQEATIKFNASNRIRECFCENPVWTFDIISTSMADN
jgi:hypothetical protein